MKYQTVKMYLDQRIEFESAGVARRTPLVKVADLARLGELAFSDSRGEDWRRAVDGIARYAVEKVRGVATVPPTPSPVPAPDTLKAMQVYADATASLILQRDAKTGETRSAVTDRDDVRELVKREVATFHRSMHRGVWKEGELYEQGQMVTRSGSTWSVQRDGGRGKPGESPDFLLVVKKGADAR